MVKETLQIRKVDLKDLDEIVSFLSIAGSSLYSFRYFDYRPLKVINNHLITILLYQGDNPVGYGHLDKDGNTIWLGIAIAPNVRGKGLGKKVMQFLVDYSDENNIKELSLTVEKNNSAGITLFQNFGFISISDVNTRSILMKRTIN